MQLPAVRSKMCVRATTDVQRDHRAGFIRNRFELDVSEISTKPRGSRRSDLPLARTRTRHLMGKPPVLGHDIGVTDGQEAFQ